MISIGPKQEEVTKIRLAWTCLEAVTRAMGAEQEVELLKVKTLCWQDVRNWFPADHALTLAEARALVRIKAGIEKKLVIGANNDTFHIMRDSVGNDKGREAAYDFGQKLVRWSNQMERRFLDRLFNREPVLQTDKLLTVLKAAEQALRAWWLRYTDAVDEAADAADAAT